MKRFGATMCAAAVLLLAASSVHAQASFGLGAGLTMPMGNYGDFASMGFHGQGSVNFALGTGPLGVRADLVYHRTGLEGGADGSTTLFGGTANVIYNLSSAGPVRPYGLLGAGYFTETVESGGSVDDAGLGVGVGFGVNFSMATTTLFAELKYMTIGSNDTFNSANFVPLTVGVRFGGK